MVRENEKKEEKKKKLEEIHQQKVTQMIKSAEGSAGLLHKTSKPAAWEGGAQFLKKEEEYARLFDVVKQRGKSGRSIGCVMRACKIWRKSLGK